MCKSQSPVVTQHSDTQSRRSTRQFVRAAGKHFSTKISTDMTSLLQDFPKGNLDSYRKRASFDWKTLKVHLYGEDCVRFQNELWRFLESTPEFQHLVWPNLTLDEQRRRCVKQMHLLCENNYTPLAGNNWFNYLFYYDASLPVKTGILHGMVPSVLYTLGSERHMEIADKIQSFQYVGCFALTEIGHGTNVKEMRTTATYDVGSESFIFHTPDFQAAKCWVGGLGKTATHAILYAQLITPNKTNHGIHPFIVPIRDPKTMLPFPGITIGDMGEKVGLNGVDNGFLLFRHYSVPRACLLNKTADVTKDGKYTTAIKDKSKRFGASLGAVSGGRVNITTMCAINASLASVIAIRYSAARAQFGPPNQPEWPVIEYQTQQGRLLPHLAATYAMTIFSDQFYSQLMEFHNTMITGENKDVASLGMEIHALSSAAKPLCAWTARDIIQDCRESCGGHGYLKVSRLGDIRADNDANCTYEGENNVLVQQASNWLMGQCTNVLNGKPVSSPLNSAKFLDNFQNIARMKFNHTTMAETLLPQNLLNALKWLTCYYLTKTMEKIKSLKQNGKCDFITRNDSQLFYARTLSLVYAEHAIVQSFIERTESSEWTEDERLVLRKLCSLYAATIIEKRLGDFYAGGFAIPLCGMEVHIREGIIVLCKELVDEAVALVDVLAPPDFIVNSPLGMSDGKVYEHLEEAFRKDPQNLERPIWWKEILKSKL